MTKHPTNINSKYSKHCRKCIKDAIKTYEESKQPKR